MSREEFITYIESIGFKYYKKDSISVRYEYLCLTKYRIDIYRDIYYDIYDFWNGSEFVQNIHLNDLRLIQECFKKELRSIKLRNILG